ncbi:MAG: hypothetical protein ACRDAU_10855 [Clostridium sp.]
MSDIFNPISNINSNLNINFDRQKSERAGKVYEGIEFRDYLKSLEGNKQNIEFIMEKKLIDKFFNSVDQLYNKQNKVKLDKEKLFDIYIKNINNMEDIYACHLAFLKEIYM